MTRAAYCWVGDCDAALEWADHRWHCPKGHRLRHLSKWTSDHIAAMQGDPGLRRRYFGDIQ